MNTLPTGEHELRDYFAAHALEGLLGSGYLDQLCKEKSERGRGEDAMAAARHATCLLAYLLAEEMVGVRQGGLS